MACSNKILEPDERIGAVLKKWQSGEGLPGCFQQISVLFQQGFHNAVLGMQNDLIGSLMKMAMTGFEPVTHGL